MNKKADISPVFKYIMAAIVGVMFIAFFAGFAMQHQNSAAKIETGRIVFGFDDLLTLFSTSGEASMTYPEQGFPQAVSLTIKDGKISSGTISKTTTKIVFSQTSLKGNKFYIWTKRWKLPFTIDNFFYITDGRVATYIIYDQDSKELADELTDKYEGFPKTFNADKLNIAQLDAKTVLALKAQSVDYTKTRFVVLSSRKPTLEGFKSTDMLTIKPIEADSKKNWDYGTAEFTDGESYYLGKEMLIGAIMAENKKSYEASADAAMAKLSIMSRIYEKKAGILEKNCPGSYNLIKQALTTFAAEQPSKSTLGRINTEVQNLKESNRQFPSGCPEVF